jgi:dihydroflavonol-4-reductase
MVVLVTGADGFLGSNLVRELLSRGHTVRAFLEPGRNTGTLDGLPVEEARGDLLREDDLVRAARGCAALIHTAASTCTWPNRAPSLQRINVEGTASVIRAVRRAGVARLVHVSSASALGAGSRENPGTETTPYGNAGFGIGYVDTKHRTQQLVLQAVRAEGLPAVVVAPTFMLGPYDSKPGSGSMIVALYKRKIPVIPPGGKNYVSVKDVAFALAAALDRGRIGECYIAGHENLSYREAFGLIAETIGVRPPRLELPAAAVKAVGALGSLAGALLRADPGLTYPMARIACDGQYFCATKAVRELGLPQTPVRQAVREAFEWFRDHGYLEDRRRPARERPEPWRATCR